MSLRSQGKRKAEPEELSEVSGSDDESFPEIDFSEQDLEETDQDLQERLEEEQLERELAEEQETTDDDASDDGSDVSDWIARHSELPAEGTPGTSPDNDAPLDFAKKRRLVKSDVTGVAKSEWDEIDIEDDSEPEVENRIGNIPAHFYDDMPHVGYDINGKKVMKPLKGDELDKFLATVDGSAWTSVMDKTRQQNVELTDEELDLIKRLARSENPDGNYDPYEPTIEWYTSKEMVTPVSGAPEPKRRFIPSKWEHKKVMKIVAAIRAGRILPRKPVSAQPKFYPIWTDNDQERGYHPMHMPAPKIALPTHAESYNPPAEYLYTEEERKAWEEAEPEDRVTDYLPAKYDSLRKVPAYHDFVQQRFSRCLDLYLAPRAHRKNKILTDEDVEALKPKLPSPSELKPFPIVCTVTYAHPNGVRIRCVAFDPTGAWIATGAEDGFVRLWEVKTGRCARTWQIGKKGNPVTAVAWCPLADKSFFVVATENQLTVVALLDVAGPVREASTVAYLNQGFTASREGLAPLLKWDKAPEAKRDSGIWLILDIRGTPKHISFHRKGDYFVTVSPDGAANSVMIHQISKHHTQAPFKKLKVGVERALFHPSKPHLFVATQREVKVFDLAGQALVKTLHPGLKMVSSLAVHPLGDNVLVGSYDKRIVWHDLDLSDRPYKTLRYHSKAVRSVAFSPAHPLFFSAADDATIHVFHASVYTDLVTEPLIVPVKVLKGHEEEGALGILDAQWHPKEPWIVSVGADGVGRLYCN